MGGYKVNKTILVVDDEKIIVENIKAYLENSDYKVLTAYDGQTALDIINSNDIDLIVLDLMLPKLSGEEVCQEVRKNFNIPIIMLTAKVSEENRINGFELGADIYLTKPFSLKELVTIVKSIFRRVDNVNNNSFVLFNNGDLKINYDEFIILKKDEDCKLTKSERNILFSLSKHPRKVFTRDELIEIALGEDFNGYDRAIDTHVKNLRLKIEDDTAKPKYILTVRGVGYRFGDVI